MRIQPRKDYADSDFGGRLKAVRESLGMTEEVFSQTYAIDPDRIKHWEAGGLVTRGESVVVLLVRIIAADPKGAVDIAHRCSSCAL